MIAGTDFMLARVEDVWSGAREHGRNARWVPSSVMAHVNRPNAVCLASPDGIVSIALEPRSDGRMLAFVVAAMATGGPGAFKRNEPAMVAIARDMGAELLGFRSVRKGWIRVLGPEWVNLGDIFEREV